MLSSMGFVFWGIFIAVLVILIYIFASLFTRDDIKGALIRNEDMFLCFAYIIFMLGIIILSIYVVFGSVNALFIYMFPLIMFVSATVFFYTKKDLFFGFCIIIALLLLLFSTFSLELVDRTIGIESGVHIQEDSGISFSYLDSQILFMNDETYLQYDIDFNANNSEDGVFFHFYVDSPFKDATFSVVLTGGTQPVERGGRWIREAITIFDLTYDNNSPITGIVELDNTTNYRITIRSHFRPIAPNAVVRVYVDGYEHNPNMGMSMEVGFPIITYECMEPCIEPYSKELLVKPNYKDLTRFSRRTDVPMNYNFIEQFNASEIHFSIRTMFRLPSLLRMVVLSVMAGVTLFILTILFKRRDEKVKTPSHTSG